MDRLINIRDLTPGMVVVRVTQQNGPVKIRKTGLVTSQAMVQGLVEMGIQEVEIDPEQTVEIEAPEVKMSATRKMLESNKVTNTRIEDGLSEQFHRSLFLPSVQDIPAAWLFYTKRYAMAVFIAISGFGLGWVLAHYQEVQTALVSIPTESPEIEDATIETVLPEEPKPVAADPIEPADNGTPNTGKLAEKVEDVITSVDDTITTAEDSVSKDVVVIPDIDSEPVTPKAEEQPISADLLARFREAVSEVADEPDGSDIVDNEDSNGVPKVEKLPVWVLTELPNMSFSAHMYASNDTERWVRVNGTKMFEGDMIDDSVEIINILPQMVILNYEGHEFSMDALTDW